MQCKHLYHRHGGKITSLFAIEHSTHRKQAAWEWRGRVEWSDGSVSELAHIPPICVVVDSATYEEGQFEYDKANAALMSYLQRNGTWDRKAMRWIPHANSGSEPVGDL